MLIPNSQSGSIASVDFFPLMRELVSTYEAFYRSDVVQLSKFGLTVHQFDVVATLGNTPGLKIRHLQQKCLITSNCLLSVIDELEQAGLLEKELLLPQQPVISTVVKLTIKGEQLFKECFPIHIEYLQSIFSQLEPSEILLLKSFLGRLKRAFQSSDSF
jgi:MarR family transcriptional regulator, 2-MHQ and catechol-resistance regulon repressor